MMQVFLLGSGKNPPWVSFLTGFESLVVFIITAGCEKSLEKHILIAAGMAAKEK